MKGPLVHQVFGKPADSAVSRIFILPYSLVCSEEKHHLSGESVSILLSDLGEGWPISLWSAFSVGFLCASLQQQSYTQPEDLHGHNPKTSAMDPQTNLRHVRGRRMQISVLWLMQINRQSVIPRPETQEARCHACERQRHLHEVPVCFQTWCAS